MKLYELSKKGDFFVTYNATLSDANKILLQDIFKKFLRKEEVIIDIDGLNKYSIREEHTADAFFREALKQFGCMYPSVATFEDEDIEFAKVPVEENNQITFKKICRVKMNLHIYPLLYHLIFDEFESVREDAVDNLINYIEKNNNERIRNISKEVGLSIYDDDYLENEKNKLLLINTFMDLLKFEIEKVEPMPNNQLAHIESVASYKRLRKVLDEYKTNHHYYSTFEIDEDDLSDYPILQSEYKEDTYCYVLGIDKHK